MGIKKKSKKRRRRVNGYAHVTLRKGNNIIWRSDTIYKISLIFLVLFPAKPVRVNSLSPGRVDSYSLGLAPLQSFREKEIG